MKYTITISIFLMLFVNTAVAATYTATVPKDLDVTTPTEGSTPPREMNDSVREVKVVEKNQYTMLSVGTNTTLTGTSTFIIGSSSTALTLNFPTASTIATSTCTKEYVILNRNTGTVTLNVAVEGISGSPTVSQNGGILLYTDGTTWFEKRVQNAYNATNFGNIGTSSFARSGANSDITAITGLTTYLAVGQGGSGSNTAAGAASAFGVGTEDTPTFTGVVATGSSTLTTINSTTGNVTNLSTTTGTVTTLYSTTGNITNQTTTTGTITTLYNTTGNVTNLVTTTGTVTILNSTTSNITTGNITNQVTTTGTVTTLNSTTGNVTNLNTTTGTVTTLYSTTGNITNQVTTTGTITTLNNTNLTTTTGTITTLNNTNLSGGSGTFTGNVQAASATGFDFLKQWAVGSVVGTGNVNYVAATGIDLAATYSNGVGTITITGVGTASAGGWTNTGTQTIGLAGDQVLPGGTLTIHADYGITGLTDAWIPNDLTLDNLTQVTTRNYNDITGTSTISPTTATITTAVITNATITNGTITNAYGVGFDDIAGLPSTNTELARYIGIDTLLLPGTTTPLAGTGTSQRVYNLVRTKTTVDVDSNSVLALQCNNVGTTTFTDSSNNAYAVTANGNAIGSSTVVRTGGLGSGWLDGDGDFLTVADNSGMPNGTASFSIETTFRLGTVSGLIDFCNQTSNGSNYWSWYWNNSNNRIYFESTTGGVGDISFSATHTFVAGTTYTICVDRNGTGASNWKIFVDGDSKALTLWDGGWGGSIYAASVNLAIGGRTDSTLEINGLIDDFHLSNISRHQVNYTPLLIDATYNYYTFQIIPPGTTTAFVNIADNGTFSTDVEIVLGSTTPFGSTTKHVLQGITASRTLFGFYDAYCFEASKDIIGSGASVQDEAYAIAKKVNIVKSHPVDPKKKVTQEEAGFAAQEDYMNKFSKGDIETYKTDHITEYTTGVAGSISVNLGKLNSDAQAYHENLRKIEFAVLPDINERIRIKKKTMESDKNITSISIIADSESTDDLLKGADKRTASINNQIGVLFGAFQRQTEEIGSITAAFENQKIAYNEEVDNLYKWINAIIIAIIALGAGSGGWATLRNKRKGT